MTTVQQETQAKISSLYQEHGAFFAFGEKQFNEKRVEGVEYCTVTGGLIVPVANSSKLVESMIEILDEGRAKDLAVNGKKGIIRRELFNHEAFYTYSLGDTIDAVSEYGITRDEVVEVFNHIRTTEDVDC